jgi:hypothetical protein
LFQPSSEHDVVPLSLAFELDCFSGPDGDSGQSSIGGRSVVDQMLLDDVGDVVRVMSDVAQERASALCLVETKIAGRWTAISKEWALAGYAPVAALHFIWSQNWNVM